MKFQPRIPNVLHHDRFVKPGHSWGDKRRSIDPASRMGRSGLDALLKRRAYDYSYDRAHDLNVRIHPVFQLKHTHPRARGAALVDVVKAPKSSQSSSGKKGSRHGPSVPTNIVEPVKYNFVFGFEPNLKIVEDVSIRLFPGSSVYEPDNNYVGLLLYETTGQVEAGTIAIVNSEDFRSFHAELCRKLFPFGTEPSDLYAEGFSYMELVSHGSLTGFIPDSTTLNMRNSTRATIRNMKHFTNTRTMSARGQEIVTTFLNKYWKNQNTISNVVVSVGELLNLP